MLYFDSQPNLLETLYSLNQRLSHKAAWIKIIAIATSLGDDVLFMELSFLSLVIPTHRLSSPKLIKQFYHSNNYQIKFEKENSPHHPGGFIFLPLEIPW